MIRRGFIALIFAAVLSAALSARAESPSIGGDDDIGSVLMGLIGKRVTIRTESGQDLTGTLVSVNADVIHLSELAGKEYYDGVVATQAVEAVIVRVK